MTNSIRNKIVLALSLLFVACGGSEDSSINTALPTAALTPPPDAGAIGDGRLEGLAEWARESQGVPALGVVIVADDRIAEIAAVGRRSVSVDDAVTDNDRWHIGSLTKSLTATLAAVLIQQSVITWDTTPIDIWPELAGSMHPQFRNVTIKQLLSHTSGMRRADLVPVEFTQNATGSAMERRRLFAAVLLAEPPIGPAGRESYSNGGLIVAGAMMETIMSTPWETLLTQQVFAPLGMTDSGFGAPGTSSTTDQPWGHWDRGTYFEEVPPGPAADNPDTMGPAGTVHATLHDYAQFMLAHLAGSRDFDGLVTASTFDVLQTPIHNGSAPAWGVTAFKGWAEGPVLSYAGSNQRWYAVVRLAPGLNAGSMVVVNAGGGRAKAAIDAFGDLLLERFQASR